MKLLAFDTSTETMHIAVQNGNVLHTHTGEGGAQASGSLIASILRLLQEAGLELKALDAIAFGRGPGSFTGLRTACSVAQGLAFGARVQVLPVDTLMAVAQHAYDTTGATRICAALDARMGEVYYTYYYFDSKLRNIDEGYSLKTPKNMHLLDNFENTLLAGNIATVYGAQLLCAMQMAQQLHCGPTALAMLRLAPALIAAGQLVAPEDALPLYVRDKVAQTTDERAALSVKMAH